MKKRRTKRIPTKVEDSSPIDASSWIATHPEPVVAKKTRVRSRKKVSSPPRKARTTRRKANA